MSKEGLQKVIQREPVDSASVHGNFVSTEDLRDLFTFHENISLSNLCKIISNLNLKVWCWCLDRPRSAFCGSCGCNLCYAQRKGVMEVKLDMKQREASEKMNWSEKWINFLLGNGFCLVQMLFLLFHMPYAKLEPV